MDGEEGADYGNNHSLPNVPSYPHAPKLNMPVTAPSLPKITGRNLESGRRCLIQEGENCTDFQTIIKQGNQGPRANWTYLRFQLES